MQPYLVVIVLAAIIALALVAKRVGLPYPVAFVIGGVLLAFFPQLPAVRLDPQWIFLIVLPPILFSGGWTTDWLEFKRNRRPILLLAIGLVIFTTAIIATVAHGLIPGMTWPLAVTLGAIVAPPDAIAAEAVFERIGLPRRLVAIITGESLVNDASALVIYRFAVAAVATGAFSLHQAALQFVVVSIGGIAAGFIVAVVIEIVQKMLTRTELAEPAIVNALMLVAPFAAYWPSDAIGVSGVLATVTAGIYLGRRATHIFDPQTRLVAASFWEVFLFILNGVVFVVLGLQLRGIVADLHGTALQYALDAAVIAAIVIALRFIWVFPATYIPRYLSKRIREADPLPPWQAVTVVSWSGMRGILSLAAAMAIPYTDAIGAPVELRSLVVFLAFCVIFVTLVLQGSTLGWVIDKLGIAETGIRERKETEIRIKALEAGLRHLRALEAGFTTAQQWEAAGRLMREYEERIKHLQGHLDANDADGEPEENRIDHELEREALSAERTSISWMRRRGEIPDDVYRNIEYDLDLADLRLR